MPRIPDRSKFNIIRLALHGCTNRPFYHIVVCRNRHPRNGPVVEKIGNFDPMPNYYGEKHVALDLERFHHHMANGTKMTKTVEKLMGIGGLLPIHPMTYIEAKRLEQGKEEKKDSSLRHFSEDVFKDVERRKSEDSEKTQKNQDSN